jgi:hypothetical protein
VTVERSSEWRALLEAERARRAARTECEAGEGDRAAQQLVDELQEMARRMAATAHLSPLDLGDMSIAEKVACHLLPESMRPEGLPSEAEIWRQYRARVPENNQ